MSEEREGEREEVQATVACLRCQLDIVREERPKKLVCRWGLVGAATGDRDRDRAAAA